MYFYLKEPNGNKVTPIYLIYRGFKKSTGEKIHPDDWNIETGMPIRRRGDHTLSSISVALGRYSAWLENLINQYRIKGERLDKNILSKEFDYTFREQKRIIYFQDYIDHFLEIAPEIRTKKNKPLTKRTLQAYTTVAGYYKDFEKGKRKRKLDQLDISLHGELTKYFHEKLGLAVNTVGWYIKNIKVFAKYADKEGYKVHPDILSGDFFVAQEESENIYLTESEVSKIYNAKLSVRLDKIRKWAIIGCWTGLRVSDWENFHGFKDNFIQIKTKKTGEIVIIPLHPQLKELLKTGLPKTCSNVEFNREIKKVCEISGINKKVYGSKRNKKTNRLESGYFHKWELVTAHTMRRSFATNLYLSGFPTIGIMSITGHRTEKSFLKYIKVTKEQHAKMLMDFWSNRYQEKF